MTIGIWQGLADQDPDVDAIYRLTNNKPCYFDKKGQIVLEKGVVSPFNSQNTAFKQETFPLLYLPSTVTFRFTDILRGLIAQPIWAMGYSLGFTEATVYQERNEHNLLKDFEQEIPCYLHGEKIIEIVSKSISKDISISDNLMRSYQSLLKNNIVKKEELKILKQWLHLIQ